MNNSNLGIHDGVHFVAEDFQDFVEEDSFLPSQRGHLYKWIGGYPLGMGGQGMVGLWIGTTRSGRIMKRLAIKRSRMLRRRWIAAENWIGPIRTGVPMGVHAHRRLSKLSKRHFLQYLSHRIEPDAHQVLTFAEYCPYGSLDDVLAELRRIARANGTEPHHIPEAWLWFLFQELAEANHYMANAVRQEDVFAVHCDLKPDNVFLVEPDNTVHEHRYYPIPKIGDFDSCRLTRDDPAENPSQFLENSDGTPGYMPPEQWYWYKRHDGSRQYLSSFNTWQIGVTMLSLLEVETNRTQMDFSEEKRHNNEPDEAVDDEEPDDPEFDAEEPLDEEPDDKEPDDEEDADDEEDDESYDDHLDTNYLRGTYSDRLIDLIDRCIERRPQNRILPDDLLTATRDGCGTNRRSTRRTALNAAPLNLPIMFRDYYKLGLSVKDPDFPRRKNVKASVNEATTFRTVVLPGDDDW